MDASPVAARRYNWPLHLWRMLRHPVRTGGEIAAWRSVRPGAWVVGIFGLYLTLGSFLSYLNHDYPPPPDVLAVWIDTWGEFAMLPVFPIPLDQYRLFMALVSTPVVIVSWVWMAASARLLGRLFQAGPAFYPYLNLFAFSFIPFWFLSAVLDAVYSNGLQPFILPGLSGQYGPLALAFFTNFPPLLYTVLFGLGGVYNGIAAWGAGRVRERQAPRFGGQVPLKGWQAGFIGWFSFIGPMVLAALVYR